MGKASRDKGRRGQSAATDLLTARDWTVAELNAGKISEDLLATDPDGRTWAVEVKNTRNWLSTYLTQAREQAKARRLPWMLMWHIPGTSEWLVMRQGRQAVVWTSLCLDLGDLDPGIINPAEQAGACRAID